MDHLIPIIRTDNTCAKVCKSIDEASDYLTKHPALRSLSIASDCRSLSNSELLAIYNHVTGKEVKKFSSKDDGIKRLMKFLNPTGKAIARKKAVAKPVKQRIVTTKKKQPTAKKSSKTNNGIIKLLPLKKNFQEGSLRGSCYNLIKNNMSIISYLDLAKKHNLKSARAILMDFSRNGIVEIK